MIVKFWKDRIHAFTCFNKRKFLRSGDQAHYDERELRTTPEEKWKSFSGKTDAANRDATFDS